MNINNVLTRKGGVGKSLVCALLGCYFQERQQRTLSLDLDSNQPTFTRYKGLGVRRVELARNGEVDSGLFDNALEEIYGPNVHEGIPRDDLDQVVIDSGAGSYLPFVDYMRREGVMDVFAELGYQHTLHVVLAGGQSLEDCLISLDQLASLFGRGSRVVVWLNEHFAPLPWGGPEEFYDNSKVYRKHHQLIHGVVRMPKLRSQTEEPAFARFSEAHQTFNEATSSGKIKFSDSQRLRRIRAYYYDQLDLVFGEVSPDAHDYAAEAE